MKKLNNVIHLENDVLLYSNMNYTFDEKIYITMDSKNRCIPGIMYIPNYSLLTKFIKNYDFTKNDMINLANFYLNNKDIVKTFPIIDNSLNKCIYNDNFQEFNSIFDGAAIGQYLGGFDPRNIPGDSTGFVNETCEIKYDKYTFKWVKKGRHYFPHIEINSKLIPINNLHIHSKKVKNFRIKNPIENKYIRIQNDNVVRQVPFNSDKNNKKIGNYYIKRKNPFENKYLDNKNYNYGQGYYGLKYHMEEAYNEHNISSLPKVNPEYAIFSNKYYESINKLNHDKKYDYCFIGYMHNFKIRGWIIDFAKKYFTNNSVYVNTGITNDKISDYKVLGDFDYTIKQLGNHYNPKNHHKNQSYNAQYRKVEENLFYFQTMCQSKYCLCPSGIDEPWSFRFYEILMCNSIPLLNNPEHAYRTKSESKIQYQYLLYDDKFDEVIKNITDKQYNYAKTWNNKLFKKYHMIQKQINFITGEKIQFMCDHFVGTDKDFKFNPNISQYKNRFIYIGEDKKIDNNPLVFCYTHLLDNINKLITTLKGMKNKFILIFHNSDFDFNQKHLILFEKVPLLQRIYTQNINVEHKKVFPLPIGLANSQWTHGNSKIHQKVYELPIEKTKEIYFNFNKNTNREKRNKCYDDIIKKGIIWNVNLPYREYLIELKRHKYAICPEGNGIDTHRFWECLYMNTIPICLKNKVTEYYKKYFPIIILNDWQELDVNKLSYSVFDHQYLDMGWIIKQIKVLTLDKINYNNFSSWNKKLNIENLEKVENLIDSFFS